MFVKVLAIIQINEYNRSVEEIQYELYNDDRNVRNMGYIGKKNSFVM